MRSCLIVLALLAAPLGGALDQQDFHEDLHLQDLWHLGNTNDSKSQPTATENEDLDENHHLAEEALKQTRMALERTIDEVMKEVAMKAIDGEGYYNQNDDLQERGENRASNSTSNGAAEGKASERRVPQSHIEFVPPPKGAPILVVPLHAADKAPEVVEAAGFKETKGALQGVTQEVSQGVTQEVSQGVSSQQGWCSTAQPTPLRLPALPNCVPDSLDQQCARDSMLMDLHLRNHTLWAVQMQDAGASGIEGLLEGNVYHLGDFDECMEVTGPVLTQYCVAEVRIHTPQRTPDHRLHPDTRPDPMQSVWNTIRHEGEDWRLPLDVVHVALCAPASCPASHLQAAVQRALAAHANCSRLPVAFSATIQDVLCTSASKQKPPLSKGELAYIVIVVMILMSSMAGTLIDLYAKKKKGCLRSFLLMFSLIRNWHMLTKADPRPAGLDLDSMSGARTINMLLLVLAHRGFNLLRGPAHNYNHFQVAPRRMLNTGATHAQLFVDTCFVMSGLLVSLLELTRARAAALKHCDDAQHRPGLMAAVVHRYLRLTPSYAMVVFFYASIFWRLGSGPLWDQVIGYESEACAKYWWTNLFYVNNYINTDQLCMFQSWYLPCDLHLFFVGSALTMVLARHRRTGLAFIGLFLVASVLIPFVLTVTGRKPALLEMLPILFRAPDQSANFRTMYAPTHIRAAPYIIGLLVGYLFHLHGVSVKERFSAGVTWLLCLGGIALTTGAMLSSVVFYDPDMAYDSWVAGAYASLCPVIWSIGLSLVLASTVLGSRSPMSIILSWRPMVILSRLTYNVYLTHWGIQMASVAKMRSAVHLDVYNVFTMAFGDIVSSFVAAVVLFLLVEAPFRSLARRVTAAPAESRAHMRSTDEAKPPSLEAGVTRSYPRRNL